MDIYVSYYSWDVLGAHPFLLKGKKHQDKLKKQNLRHDFVSKSFTCLLTHNFKNLYANTFQWPQDHLWFVKDVKIK